jgi:hypothetical protein
MYTQIKFHIPLFPDILMLTNSRTYEYFHKS